MRERLHLWLFGQVSRREAARRMEWVRTTCFCSYSQMRLLDDGRVTCACGKRERQTP